MRKYIPLIAAALLLTLGALADTNFLGNILQLHNQAEPLPTASTHTGAIVYNTTQSQPYFSNGTTWASMVGSGSGSGPWLDAGVFASDRNGSYLSAPGTQAIIGTDTVSMVGYSPTSGLSSPLRNPLLYVFADAGTSATLHLRNNVASITRSQFLPVSTDWLGANLWLHSDKTGSLGGANYAQLAFEASNSVAPGGNEAVDHITSVRTATALGGDGAFANGLNIHVATGGYLTMSTGGNTSSLPSMYIEPDGQVSMGSGSTTLGYLLTLDQSSFSTGGIRINGTVTTGVGFGTSGTDLDLGAGTDDYWESNGTRIVSPGGVNVANLRTTGNASSSSGMLNTATVGAGTIGFRQSDGQHYKVTTARNYAPILSGPDWFLDGRPWNVEVPFEYTGCPVVRQNVLNTSSTDVTVSCSDAASSTSSTGAGHPARAYRNFVTSATGGDRSIFMSGTAPASGVGATPQLFASRRGGYVVQFALSTGSANWTSNITWYAGLFSLIPANGSPTGNSVYIRFDTNNPAPSSTADTRFRLCACSSSTCTCSNLSVAPAVSTEYVFTIDCRESSSECYAYMNGSYETVVSSNLPGLTNNLGFAFAIENVDAAARTAGLSKVSIRQE